MSLTSYPATDMLTASFPPIDAAIALQIKKPTGDPITARAVTGNPGPESSDSPGRGGQPYPEPAIQSAGSGYEDSPGLLLDKLSLFQTPVEAEETGRLHSFDAAESDLSPVLLSEKTAAFGFIEFA